MVNAVTSCMQPGMSIAAVATAHGVNANALRRSMRDVDMEPFARAVTKIAAHQVQAHERKALFVPVGLPASTAPAPCADTLNELQGGGTAAPVA